MSHNKPPLISPSPAASIDSEDSETSAPQSQRKCGRVHRNNENSPQVTTKKRSVDTVVEAFLDENPAFLNDYVRRKISRRQLEQWLFLPSSKIPASNSAKVWSPKLVHSSDSNLLKTGALLSCVRGQPPCEGGQQRQRSRSFTPLRKLSATTFEAGGLATPILATTNDGEPSFLRTISGVSSSSSTEKKQVPPLSSPLTNITDRKELLLALLSDLMLHSNASTPEFAKTLLKSANLLLGQAQRLELLLLRAPNTFEGTVYTLENDVFGQRMDSLPANPLLNGVLTVPRVLNVNERVTLADDRTYNNALLGPLQKAEGGQTQGCIQLYDKPGGFSNDDERLLTHLLSFASVGLTNLMVQQETRLELARSEVFLELARTVFREPTKLESTMLIILTNFLSLIDCERCQISLCDRTRPSIFKRVFDLQRKDLGKADLEAPREDRLPLKSEMAAKVAITGKKINLTRGQLALDNEDDLHSFLSLPIHDPEGNVVGVISLANKESHEDKSAKAQSFSSNDERFVEAFSIFCGMAIRNAADYESAVLSEAKLQVAFEVMNFQATSNIEEASTLSSLVVPASSSSHIDSFEFSYLNLEDNDTLTATIRIFIDLGLMKRFSIDHSTLCRWLLTVKRNYRNETVQYHNWYHAFNVTQMMFCTLMKTTWDTSFSMMEILGLIVACISHDLDHRGTNNSFQHKMNNPLAKLYSTSTLEQHHLNQCLLILTLKGNKILDNLTKDEYAETLAVIERSILATDLALHFKIVPKLSALATKINRSSENFTSLVEHDKENRLLLQAGMMTAADLGAATKPWKVHQHVSQLIAEEFWTQGDIERNEFNINPQPMFDRSAPLHLVQLDFLDNTCLPLYEDMARFSTELQPLLDGCRANRHRWATLEDESNSTLERARNL